MLNRLFTYSTLVFLIELIMKLLVVLSLVACAVARPDGDFYDSKYDDFNVDEVISNNRLIKAYARCFIGDGKCTPEGNDFKKWIPEAISSSCGKCTDKQKVLVAKALIGLKKNLPDDYTELLLIHNPDHKYDDNLQKFLEKYSS